MDFLEDLGGSFLLYFVLFMAIAILAVVIRSIRSRSKAKGFRSYLTEHFPSLNADIPMLMAKSKSKQAKPDMALVINEGQVIILRNPKGKQIDEFVYPAAELTSLKRGNQMIGRGFAPKTWSYEEHLELIFGDGLRHQFFLENISNKHGTDKGADLVRQMFDPSFEQLSIYYNPEKPEA